VQREAEERRELLQRRNAAGHTAIEMSSLSRETRALEEASFALDNLNRHSESVLLALTVQRQVLNASRRKLVAIFDTLGLSNSLLRLIERRQLMDRLLVFGGIGACSLLLWVLLQWNRAPHVVMPSPVLAPGDAAGLGDDLAGLGTMDAGEM
jgi:Golgi SNAP receptor complex protein 2